MRDKLISVGKGALVAAAGAAVTYLTAWLAGSDPAALFGPYAPAVVSVLAVAVNAARKLVEHYREPAAEPEPEAKAD